MEARNRANNEKPFVYHTSDGVVFTCERADLTKPIQVKGLAINLDAEGNLSNALRAVAEMAAFHRAEVWPTLNGFSGYDCIKFEEVPDEGTEGQDRESYSDDQDRESYSVEPDRNQVLASNLKAGDFIVIWRDESKQAAEILGMEDGRVKYRILTGEDKDSEFMARFDPTQVLDVYDSKADAIAVTDEYEDWLNGQLDAAAQEDASNDETA